MKRFHLDDISAGRKVSFISEEAGSRLLLLSNDAEPAVEADILKGKSKTPETIQVTLSDFIDVKGLKAIGKRLSTHPVTAVRLLQNAAVPVSNDAPPQTGSGSSGTTASIPPAGNTSPDDPAAGSESAPVKKSIDLEITNAKDVDIRKDDEGQLGLF